MAIYKICKKCGELSEMIKKSDSSFGYDTTFYTCSKCGYEDKEQINRVHYGNDEIKR